MSLFLCPRWRNKSDLFIYLFKPITFRNSYKVNKIIIVCVFVWIYPDISDNRIPTKPCQHILMCAAWLTARHNGIPGAVSEGIPLPVGQHMPSAVSEGIPIYTSRTAHTECCQWRYTYTSRTVQAQCCQWGEGRAGQQLSHVLPRNFWSIPVQLLWF